MKNSNLNRSREVIDNLAIVEGDRQYAYAFAFGWAWASLTEKQRDYLLKLSQQKVNEKEGK